MFFDLQIFSGGVYPPSATSRTIQSLFLFPIVFGINLIHFFDEKKDGAAGYSIICFGASIPCHAIWQKRRRTRTVSKSATYLATETVNSAPFKRGVRERGGNFWQGNMQNSSPILRCTFWQGKVQNSSPISALLLYRGDVTSVSLSTSLCISLSHLAHLAHNIGSASALPIISESGWDAGYVLIVHVLVNLGRKHTLRCDQIFLQKYDVLKTRLAIRGMFLAISGDTFFGNAFFETRASCTLLVIHFHFLAPYKKKRGNFCENCIEKIIKGKDGQTCHQRCLQASVYCALNLYTKWGLCEYVIVHTILPPSPVILWI